MRVVAAAVLCVAAWASAAEYDVGPGQPLAEPGEVPWESLGPGDVVRIHARPTPYAAKWVLNRAGTQGSPITVRGVTDASQALPVITGTNAVTRSQLRFTNDDRGIITIGASTVPADTLAQHLVIEGLHLRRARRSEQFKNATGASVAWASDAAAIRITKGNFITVRGCIIEDVEKGLVAGTSVEDLLIERNVFRGNSTANEVGSAGLELETLRPVVQFNDFGAPVASSEAENVRDRSAGLVFRYNRVTGGNRVLLFEGASAYVSAPEYARSSVYGNVIIKPAAPLAQDATIGFEAMGARQLDLHHNTIIVQRDSRIVSLLLGTPVVRLVDNVVRAPTSMATLFDGPGSAQRQFAATRNDPLPFFAL